MAHKRQKLSTVEQVKATQQRIEAINTLDEFFEAIDIICKDYRDRRENITLKEKKK